MRIVRKYSRLLTGVLIVTAIVAAALWPEAAEVDLATVARGPMEVTLDEEGETRVRERFVVSAPVSGRLQRITHEPGDAVTSGTVVARLIPAAAPLLDPRTQAELSAALDATRAALGQAQAERARAATALARARTSERRQAELVKGGAIAPDAFDEAQSATRAAEEALRAADFAVARAENEVQLARARLQPSAAGGRIVDVVAPVDGIILKRLRESEAVVPVGEPLLEIGDAGELEVVADLLSTDAVRVRAGAPVRIEQWGGGHALDGRVRRVEPSGFMKVSALGVEEQRVNVLIDFVDATGAVRALGDGYRVEVRIVIWREDDVVKVPVGALFRRGEGWAAFVVSDGHAQVQTVDIGQRNAVDAQIVKGLAPGQQVVVHPPDTLTDGARIANRDE